MKPSISAGLRPITSGAPEPRATVRSLWTKLKRSPWCLSVIRGTQLPQPAGVHIGQSITHHRLPLGFHGLEEGVLPVLHHGLHGRRSSHHGWSGRNGRDSRLGRCRQRQVLRQEVGLSKVQKSGLTGTEQRQVLLVLGAMRTWRGKTPAKRGRVGQWCLNRRNRGQLLRMRRRWLAHSAEEGACSSSSARMYRNRLVQVQVEVRNSRTPSGLRPGLRRWHLAMSWKRHAHARSRRWSPWSEDWSLEGGEWLWVGCR